MSKWYIYFDTLKWFVQLEKLHDLGNDGDVVYKEHIGPRLCKCSKFVSCFPNSCTITSAEFLVVLTNSCTSSYHCCFKSWIRFIFSCIYCYGSPNQVSNSQLLFSTRIEWLTFLVNFQCSQVTKWLKIGKKIRKCSTSLFGATFFNTMFRAKGGKRKAK